MSAAGTPCKAILGRSFWRLLASALVENEAKMKKFFFLPYPLISILVLEGSWSWLASKILLILF